MPKWLVDEEVQPDGTVHVYPEDEEKDHMLGGLNCWCEPKVEMLESGFLVIHNQRQ
jgi:hypothetical protein